MGKALGINLGSSVTTVYAEGKGIVVREPNAIAVDSVTMEVVGIGREAVNLYNKIPGAVKLMTHIYQGNVTDYERMELMMKGVFKKTGIKKPDVVFALHGAQSSADMAAIITMMQNSGAKDIFTVDLPTVAILGSGEPIDDNRERMICDIGASNTEIGIVVGCVTKLSRTVKYGCNKLDKSIASYVRKNMHAVITDMEAKAIREAVGTLHTSYDMGNYSFGARDKTTGLPCELTINSAQTEEAMRPFAEYLTANLSSVLSKLPEKVYENIKERGILLTGGGALDGGIVPLLEDALCIPVRIAENATECAVEGLGKIIENSGVFGVLLSCPSDEM